MSTSPRCPSPFLADSDELRAPALEVGGKRRRGNFREMAEGATTLKGLRAQMGKLKNESSAMPSLCDTVEFSLRGSRRQPGSTWN